MQLRHVMLTMSVFCLAGGAAHAQQAGAPSPAEGSAVIRTETRLVLVDTVVVDKKGTYVHDLTAKDFRVWEDNKEQSIKSFSFEADPNATSKSQTRYLVLFFDNSTMEPGDQIRARDAAAKFIDKNAGPNRLMAVVNFGGSIRIAQNFTADGDRLKEVVKGVKFSSVAPNAQPASMGMPTLGSAESDFGVRSVLLALRSMAKNLASVSGRKSLILFTSGFVLNAENRPELTATIDGCNKANVAIYPIDVRGLVATVAGIASPSGLPAPRLLRATVSYTAGSFGNSFLPQHGGEAEVAPVEGRAEVAGTAAVQVAAREVAREAARAVPAVARVGVRVAVRAVQLAAARAAVRAGPVPAPVGAAALS